MASAASEAADKERHGYGFRQGLGRYSERAAASIGGSASVRTGSDLVHTGLAAAGYVGRVVGVVCDETGGVPTWDELLKSKCDNDATL